MEHTRQRNRQAVQIGRKSLKSVQKGCMDISRLCTKSKITSTRIKLDQYIQHIKWIGKENTYFNESIIYYMRVRKHIVNMYYFGFRRKR